MTGVLAPPPLTRWDQIKAFLVIFVPFTVVLGVVAGMHFYIHFATERGALESRERLNVELAQHTLANNIFAVVSDLMFLAEDIESQGLPDRDTPRNRGRVAEVFQVFARNKGLYDQIRYLDTEGMEVVRVNYNDGSPDIVAEAELQDKSSRYYAEEALRLGRGELYLSPLDLNVEEGSIELPEKPMMRFATPVFDSKGNKHGLLVLNYLGARLIEDFIRASANVADHIQLLNREGFWLRSPREGEEWGFMFGRDVTFARRYPQLWRQVSSEGEGQITTRAGLFTFTTLRPLAAALGAVGPVKSGGEKMPRDNKWIVLSHVSREALGATPVLFVRRHITLYLAMLMLIAIGSWLLARSQVRRHQAEARNEYEKMFRHTLEDMDMVAVSMDSAGRITFCNDRFLELTGWQREEVIGEEWTSNFLDPKRGEEVRDLLANACEPQSFPTRFETEVLTRNGDRRLVAWTNTLSCDVEGGLLGVTGIGDDVTDRRRNELELRKLFRAVEQSPSIVLITDRNGVIDYVNPKFTEVTGYRPEEVVGQNPRVLKSGETSPEEYQDLWDTIRQGGEWRGEFHNRKKNGELYWESASLSAIRDSSGEITHFLAVKEDITERKRLEQEVEERNRELAKTQALAAMGRMASMIAHDLRNPLSSVKMGVQILGKNGAANPETAELQQIALEQIRYMEEILSDMLTFSRPDALKPEWISIDRLLDTAIGISQKRIEQFGVTLSTHYQPGLPTLQGDANKLRQLFSNLIVNAAQATNGMPEPRVSVSAMVQLGPAGTGIQVEVCDNGCGIDLQTRDKVFEPFFTTHSKGTGLGLAIVKRIADQHRAALSLEPEEPNGTCAVVVLPTVLPQAVGGEEETPMENGNGPNR